MKLFRAAVAIAVIMISMVAIHPFANASVSSPVSGESYMIHVDQENVPVYTPSEVIYVVKSGDTLSSIAYSYGITWEGLYCKNKLVVGSNPNDITPGERLIIGVASCSNNDASTTTSNSGPVMASGTPQQIAWSLLSGVPDRETEYACLNNIVMAESGWNVTIANPYSGAYGIPQALPGDKMAGPWGSDWETSAYVQLYWMIRVYIPASYGTPCDAWLFHLSHGWY